MNINNIYSVKFKIIMQIISEMKQERCIGEKPVKEGMHGRRQKRQPRGCELCIVNVKLKEEVWHKDE